MSDGAERFGLTVRTTVLFVAVYFGTNFIALSRGISRSIAFDWEAAIPLVDAFWPIYLSIFVVIFLPIFILPIERLRLFARQCAVAIGVSGIIFLLWPNVLAYKGDWISHDLALGGHLIRILDQPYNTFPSLHVSLATLCAYHLAGAFRRYRWLVGLWLALTYCSVLFTHQHHVLDVAGGIAIAFIVTRSGNEQTWALNRF